MHGNEIEDDCGTEDMDDSSKVKLYIGQIPPGVEEKEIIEIFSQFGEVLEFRFIRDKATSTFKGSAFLSFLDDSCAMKAMDQAQDRLVLRQGALPLKLRVAESQAERNNKLFVGMLPKSLTDEDLYTMFAGYGEIKEVHVIRTSEGLSKGCAFVKFKGKDSAIKAIKNLNNVTPLGGSRPLVVKFANGSRKKFDEGEGVNTMDANPYESAQYWLARSHSSSSSASHQDNLVYSYPGADLDPNHVAAAMHSYQYDHSVAPSSQFMYVPSEINYVYAPSPIIYQDAAQLHPTVKTLLPNGSESSTSDPSSGRQVPYVNAKSSDSRNFQSFGHEIDNVGFANVSATTSNESQESAGGLPLIEPSSSEDMDSARTVEGPPGANLFIYHLPRDLADADLATLFSNFGEVLSAKVFVDKKTQESKGFGFVSFSTSASAETAISTMNGFQIGNKRLKVQHKRLPGSEEYISPPGSGRGNYSGRMPPTHGSQAMMLGNAQQMVHMQMPSQRQQHYLQRQLQVQLQQQLHQQPPGSQGLHSDPYLSGSMVGHSISYHSGYQHSPHQSMQPPPSHAQLNSLQLPPAVQYQHPQMLYDVHGVPAKVDARNQNQAKAGHQHYAMQPELATMPKQGTQQYVVGGRAGPPHIPQLQISAVQRNSFTNASMPAPAQQPSQDPLQQQQHFHPLYQQQHQQHQQQQQHSLQQQASVQQHYVLKPSSQQSQTQHYPYNNYQG